MLAVAVDAQGPDVARRFTEAARVTFPTAVDRSQGLWELYDFKVIPNGFFVDERGIVRYMKIGSFDVRDPSERQAIEQLLAGPAEKGVDKKPNFATLKQALREADEAARQNPHDLGVQLTLAERLEASKQCERSRRIFKAALEKKPGSVRALLGLAAVELDMGEREKALAALRKAWALDRQNWVIRKQIWAVEHPNEFYPAINTEWQREEIKKEDTRTQNP